MWPNPDAVLTIVCSSRNARRCWCRAPTARACAWRTSWCAICPTTPHSAWTGSTTPTRCFCLPLTTELHPYITTVAYQTGHGPNSDRVWHEQCSNWTHIVPSLMWKIIESCPKCNHVCTEKCLNLWFKSDQTWVLNWVAANKFRFSSKCTKVAYRSLSSVLIMSLRTVKTICDATIALC